MGINVKVQKAPKPKEVVIAYTKLEKDLRSCMRCRFFYGSKNLCIANKCVKEDENSVVIKKEENSICANCPYIQAEGYCFPCMKKLLGQTEKEMQNNNDLEMV